MTVDELKAQVDSQITNQTTEGAITPEIVGDNINDLADILASDEAKIATNSEDIVTYAGDIANNTNNIATNTAAIATNTSAIAGKQDALGYTPQDEAEKGQANGYASLGSDGLVPTDQLPEATPYELPIATDTILGGVKQGSGVTIAGDGTLSATAGATAPVWNRKGVVLEPVYAADQNLLAEPSLLYEGSPQVLTNTSGSVFKMWFTQGYDNPNICYAESEDGITWVRKSGFVVAGHARGCVTKIGSTYYMFTSLGTSGNQIDRYTSSDGITWTLATSAVIVKGGTGWRQNSVANCSVLYDTDDSTWKILVDGLSSTGVFSLGYFHSTDGITWTEYGSNPVFAITGTVGAADLHKIGSTYYSWVLCANGAFATLPTDIYRMSSNDMINWTLANSSQPTLARLMADEGVNSIYGQLADPALIEVNGQTYIYFTATNDGHVSSVGHIKMAISNMSMANLIQTNEGDNSIKEVSKVNAYDKIISDSKYIQVGATYQTGPLYIESPFDGYRVRATGTPTSYANLKPDELDFVKTSVLNYLTTGSGGWTFTANSTIGGYSFTNNNGTQFSIDSAGNIIVKTMTLSVAPNGEDGTAFDFLGRIGANGNLFKIASKSVARVLWTNNASVSLTNTVAGTSLIPTGVGSLLLPQTISVIIGAHYRIKFGGVYSAPATPGNIILVLAVGGQTIATCTLSALGASANNQMFDAEVTFVILGTGTSSSVLVDGKIDYNTADNAAPLRAAMNNGGVAVTASNFLNYPAGLTLTGQWDTAASTKIFKVNKFSLEVIN